MGFIRPIISRWQNRANGTEQMMCLYLGRYSISKARTIVWPSSVSGKGHHSLVFTNQLPAYAYLPRYPTPSR